ncbi:alpha/beta hydrolase [Aquamicrobium zhengzhouense]|nr:alpha/beta hydrolase [Aquamicrobium zhengzhouense]
MASLPSLLLTPFLLLAAALPVSAANGLVSETKMIASAESVSREATFAYQLIKPKQASGRIMVLMHGSGGDETTLLDLASRIAPDATLIGVRGRVVQDGIKRWYKRLTPTEFDQQDVRDEATAFVAFMREKAEELKLDLSKATFLGYSNGANLIAALTQLYPGTVRKAVLLRPMPVLANAPQVDLSDSKFLTIAGEDDKLYYPFADRLHKMLASCGASVDARVIDTGHGLGEEDVRIVADWLGQANR